MEKKKKKFHLRLIAVAIAPAPTILAMPPSTEPEITGKRKRKVSSRITDDNFIGAESNAVTKRLKLSAEKNVARRSKEPEKTARRKASTSVSMDNTNVTMTKNHLVSSSDGTKHSLKSSSAASHTLKRQQKHHSSVEDIEEEDTPVNCSPKNPNALLEAADGSDDIDIEFLDVHRAPALQQSGEEDDEEEGEEAEHVETAEEQRRESIKVLQQS